MNLLKRLRNLWALSEAEMHPASADAVPYADQVQLKVSKPATFIPYTKEDPVEKIVNQV